MVKGLYFRSLSGESLVGPESDGVASRRSRHSFVDSVSALLRKEHQLSVW